MAVRAARGSGRRAARVRLGRGGQEGRRAVGGFGGLGSLNGLGGSLRNRRRRAGGDRRERGGRSVTRLDVQDVTVRFGGVTAVNAATISADGGRVTALIGPNGAGKTTLFNVITGLQKPTAGRVFLTGNDI